MNQLLFILSAVLPFTFIVLGILFALAVRPD
jgi:hypothetical protein